MAPIFNFNLNMGNITTSIIIEEAPIAIRHSVVLEVGRDGPHSQRFIVGKSGTPR